MIIRIYKVEGYTPSTCLGVIDDYQSFNFTKSFKKVGSWELKGYLPPQAAEILVPGNLMFVNERICGLIDGVEFTTDEQGITTYTAYGNELKNILSYRVLWHNYFYAPGGNIPSAEGWMRMLTYYSCIEDERTSQMFLNKNRGLIHHLDTDANDMKLENIGTPAIDTFFKLGDNLLDSLSYICGYFKTNKGLPLGFDVVMKDAKQSYFTVYEGQDRTWQSKNPIVFSREYDNIAHLEYANSNRNTINVVRVMGDGKYAITESFEKLSGFARREKYVDESSEGKEIRQPDGTTKVLSDDEYIKKLVETAYDNTKSDIKNLEAQIVEKGTKLPDYSLLGARVSLIDKAYNLKLDDWISEINFIDEGGEIEINYTIGKDIQAKVLKEVK